jgi:hypothetical protein
VARRRSAKPLSVGSTPTARFKTTTKFAGGPRTPRDSSTPPALPLVDFGFWILDLIEGRRAAVVIQSMTTDTTNMIEDSVAFISRQSKIQNFTDTHFFNS